MSATLHSYFSATRIVWGAPLASTLVSAIEELGVARPLVVVDDAVVAQPVVAEALAGIAVAGVHERSGAEPETTEADELCALGRDAGCDAVIGIGGGSVLDLSKAVGGLVPASGAAADYQGFNLLPGPACPVVAVPTTAGTGSEVTGTAVLVNRAKKMKLGINSPHIVPRVALLEPRLAAGMPSRLTLTAGMDAISHTVESYSARKATPITRALSLGAFRVLTGALPRALADSADLEAREATLVGSTMAGLAVMNAGTGAAHAMAYPLGVHLGVPHSVALAMLLPEIVESCERAQPGIYREEAAFVGGSLSAALRELTEPWHDELRLGQFGDPDIELLASESMNLTSAVDNHPVAFTQDDARTILEAIT